MHAPRIDIASEATKRSQNPLRRWLAPVFLLVAMVLVGYFGHTHWAAVERFIADLGPWGPLLFFGAFVILTTACLPVSVLGFSAGVLFGPLQGCLVLYPAAVTSALVMFVLGRGILRRRILGFIEQRPRLQALDRLAGQRAYRLNLLARLSPLNYGVSCYTLAVGRSSLPAYLFGLLGILPSTVVQVWLGSVGSKASRAISGERSVSNLELGLIIAGLVFFGLLSWQVGRLVKQAWRVAETDSGQELDHG